MKNTLLKMSLVSRKMRMSSILGSLLLIAMPLFANAASVSFGVTFGNPQSNDGVCVGKGVCKGESTPDAVTVSFIINEANPNILMMRFSMRELMMKQADKVASFNDPMGYSFDSEYSLVKPGFSPLSLMPGAYIPANTAFTTQISDDVVTVYIPYSHN